MTTFPVNTPRSTVIDTCNNKVAQYWEQNKSRFYWLTKLTKVKMDQKSESGFFGSLRSHVKKTITDPSTLNKEEERAPAHGNRGGCPIITDNYISDHLFYNGHLLYSYSRILKYETPINIRPLVYLLFSCLNRLAHRKYRVLQLFARAVR